MYNVVNTKQEIEHVRDHLNTAIKHGANREDILVISKRLDKLIYEYYNIETQKKRN